MNLEFIFEVMQIRYQNLTTKYQNLVTYYSLQHWKKMTLPFVVKLGSFPLSDTNLFSATGS